CSMTGHRLTALILQPRDRGLLATVAMLRVVDRDQARAIAPFGSITRANSRLLRLTHAGLLRRMFIGTASGSRRSLYTITKKGAAVANASSSQLQRKNDAGLIADLFIEHQLSVSSIYVSVCCKALPLPGATVKCWTVFKESISPRAPIVPDA